jgi:hypothetical protein
MCFLQISNKDVKRFFYFFTNVIGLNTQKQCKLSC